MQIIRPVKKDTFNVLNPIGIKWLFQIRVELSPLNAHKKQHNFLDTLDDTCQCSLGAETTQHFLLKCPNFSVRRQELFETLYPILSVNNLVDLSDMKMMHLLLYGHKKLKLHENQSVLKATISYIGKTGRFSQS